MLPVCSATTSCSSHSQISFHGGLQSLSPVRKDFDSKCIVEDWAFSGLSNGNHLQKISFKTQATKGVYSNLVESSGQRISTGFINSQSCSNELDNTQCNFSTVWSSSVGPIDNPHPMEMGELKYVESSGVSAAEEGVMDFTITDQLPENAQKLIGQVEPETVPSFDVAPENPTSFSDSLDMDNNSLSGGKIGFDNILAGISDSIDSSINRGESLVKSSLDTVNSFATSVAKSASKIVDNAVGGVFSAIDQTGSNLKEATSRSTVSAVDVLRRAIVAVEDSISNGASFVIYSYGSAKESLPPEIRDALSLSEDKAVKTLRPVGTAFQQVYIAIEGLERSFGLNPNDPVVPFVLFLGTSATLWVLYWVWTYSGYSGDLSPQKTLELLAGEENAVLIDVRPEALRERDGIPDLRRAARFRYANVTLPEVNGSLRKLMKSGRELDDSLIAVVIRNLKTIQDRSKVIVMDADGNRSKGIARSLRKLGVKRPYLLQGGFQSWTKQGLRTKELKTETALTILNEEAEAIIENTSPVQALGYGVGVIAALYAVLEWETTLQIIGVVGLAQTIYRRVVSYESAEDIKQDVRRLLAPVRLGAQAFSWVAEKLETNRIGLPTSPSSSDVQNRVLQAAAKLESQPSDAEGVQDPPPDSIAPVTE